jgi:uncharacterized membrane protein
MKEFSVKREWVLWLIWLVPLAVYLGLASRLPARIPSHYGPDGQPDAFSGAGRLLTSALSVGTLLYGVLLVLPYLDSGRKSAFLAGKAYGYVRVVVQLFLSAVFSMVFLSAAGWQFSMIRMVGLAVMLTLGILGILMTGIRPNSFVGIRTPWTLRDPAIWAKTHQVGGRGMSLVCAAGFLLILVLPERTGGMCLLPLVLAAVLFPVLYSYMLYRRKKSGR